MKSLQKAGGMAALAEAAIYVALFTTYGTVLSMPANVGPAEQLAFLTRNQLTYSLMHLIGYVLFGVLLAVLVLALHDRLKYKARAIAQIGSVFGLVWVCLVIASGMIANIGLAAVIKLATTEPDQARAVWLAINVVVEGLGGGNEVVGGLWVLLLSIAGLRGRALPRPLNVLGLFVGTVGILTIYPADVLTEIFGVSQIVWFAWLGLYLYRAP